MVTQIIEVCLIPLLGILTKYLIDFLNAKKLEASSRTDNQTAKKYIDMITKTVTDCVIATNQTYVNSLKNSQSFDEEAQKIAFNTTMNTVLAILSKDSKEYIKQATGDINLYLTALIEAEVNKQRQPGYSK